MAIPSQTCDQRTWETGVIVSAEIVEKGTGRICSGVKRAVAMKPGEQVPRIPSGSQVPCGCISIWSARVSTATWSPGSASGERRTVVRKASA